MKTDEIRQIFLDFFKSKGHAIYPSDSLVPTADPTLLFTSAGMNQFKDMFLGKGRLKDKRIATCQKCFRTGDIDKVGKTTAHHTFFEMLGNFSFGDYFKKEAIQWAWEFFTTVLKLPKEKLFASIFQDDEEAFKIWREVIGLPQSKIFRFGEDENFWPANARTQGPNGPCGPCSEIFYDFGEKYGCGRPNCQVGCPCGRYVEVWNLVFTQFDRQEGGILAPLSQKNIDTGMGLERLTAVMQGQFSNFHIDIFQPLIDAISEGLKINYQYHTPEGAKIRKIADHIRALVFLIADGVLPSNEGRGYVERKVLRFAQRDVVVLGKNEPFLHKLVDIIVEKMGTWYKELHDRKDTIIRIIKAEEQRFLQTLEKGNILLEQYIDKLKNKQQKVLCAEDTFLLYDTYGFPIDLTQQILQEHGLTVDNKGFEKLLEQQKQRARAASKFGTSVFVEGPLEEIKTRSLSCKFIGYKKSRSSANVLAIIKGEHLVENAQQGDEVAILLDKTPFYAEKGGQVGDTGIITGAKNLKIEITDTQCPEEYILHAGKIKSGKVKVGQKVVAQIEEKRRAEIMRHHTATHLLQTGLRKILGEHVQQAGSLVAPDRLRFDFTHYEAISPEKIRQIENFVNERICANEKVIIKDVSIEEAKKQGAIMLFGEKYGKVVRLVKVGEFSKELCGGTHCPNTSFILMFKIIGESSVSAGVRRIEAVAGYQAIQMMLNQANTLSNICTSLSVPEGQVIEKVKSLVEEVKKLKQEVARARRGVVTGEIEQILQESKTIGGRKIVVQRFEQKSVEELRSLADIFIKGKNAAACLLLVEKDNRQTFIIAIHSDLINKGVNAGQIAKEIGKICEGGGGGAAHMAQAGGKNTQKLKEAFEEFYKIVGKSLR